MFGCCRSAGPSKHLGKRNKPGILGHISNVNPAVPHPRWSQATEQMIGTGERVQTLKYNGYRKQVGHLYA